MKCSINSQYQQPTQPTSATIANTATALFFKWLIQNLLGLPSAGVFTIHHSLTVWTKSIPPTLQFSPRSFGIINCASITLHNKVGGFAVKYHYQYLTRPTIFTEVVENRWVNQGYSNVRSAIQAGILLW